MWPIILAESEQQLQHIIDKLGATCEQEQGCQEDKNNDHRENAWETMWSKCKRTTAYTSQGIQISGNDSIEQCKLEVAERINPANIALWKRLLFWEAPSAWKPESELRCVVMLSMVSRRCRRIQSQPMRSENRNESLFADFGTPEMFVADGPVRMPQILRSFTTVCHHLQFLN